MPHCNISIAYNWTCTYVCLTNRHGIWTSNNNISKDNASAALIAGALPMPVLVVGPQQQIIFVNPAAEQFFDTGAGLLLQAEPDRP